MFEPNYHPRFLPAINTTTELFRLLCGSILRLALHSGLYYGGYGLIMEKIRKRKGSYTLSERAALCYLLSMGLEIGVSMLVVPFRFLSAISAPRFLLDYMLNSWSDKLSMLDRFAPGKFASFATYSFERPDCDWSFDFFTWQVPSVVLSLVKLLARRRHVGAKNCRTKRVLFALGLQVILRAYMATFVTELPENDLEAVNAILVTVLEGIATSYVVRHTWPYPFDEVMDSGHSATTRSTMSSTNSTTDHTTSEERKTPISSFESTSHANKQADVVEDMSYGDN